MCLHMFSECSTRWKHDLFCYRLTVSYSASSRMVHGSRTHGDYSTQYTKGIGQQYHDRLYQLTVKC